MAVTVPPGCSCSVFRGNNILDSANRVESSQSDEEPEDTYFAELMLAWSPNWLWSDAPAMVSILSAYCDDAASQNPCTAVTIAGALADPLVWIQFSYEWKKLTDEWGIEFWHMAEFERRVPPFDWDADVRHFRLNKLLDLIEKYELPLFGTSVESEAFNRAVSRMSAGHWGGPFGLAAEMTLVMQAKQAREYLARIDATVAYFFEHGVSGWGQIEKAFNSLIGDPRWRLQTIGRVPKKVPGAQVADIVAYEWNKEFMRENGHANSPPKKRYPMERLERNQHFRAHVLEDTMALMSENIDYGMTKAILEAVLEGKRKASARIAQGGPRRDRINLPPEIQAIVDKFRPNG